MTVDLDDFTTWPSGIVPLVQDALTDLIAEREAMRAFDLSSDRWFKPSPPQPATNRIAEHVAEAMAGQHISVFHATRLLDPQQVFREGLKRLSIAERIAAIEGLAAHGPLAPFSDVLQRLLKEADLDDYRIREGQVWFTPLRRNLHDDGCDVFFDHWGGEFVERLLCYSDAGLCNTIQNIGTPSVVMARIPAFGCCQGSGDLRLIPTMLDLAIEAEGMARYPVSGWDVMLKQDVPPDWIVGVFDRDALGVADRGGRIYID